MRRVITPDEHYMFFPRPHPIPCIPPTRAQVLSQNLPLRIRYTRTQRSPCRCLLANASPSPLASLFLSLLDTDESSSTSASSKATRGILSSSAGSTSQQSGGTVSRRCYLVYVMLSCKCRWWRWTIQADIHQVALKRCVFDAWVGCDENKMEWNSGREARVWERTVVTLVGATPTCVFFRRLPLSLLPTPFITRRCHGSKCVSSFHEYMMCWCSYFI